MIYLANLILGVICSFGQPPYNFLLSSLISLALFFYLLAESKNSKEASKIGYCFGYGYFIYSFSWVSESVLAYGDVLKYLYPLGIILIPACMALYFAFMSYLIHRWAKSDIFITAIIWLMFELIRSYLYIQVPWLLVGYVWSNSIVKQTASIFSIWGLSFLSLIWVGAIRDSITFVLSKFFTNFYLDYKKSLAIILAALISFIACYLFSLHRIHCPPHLIEQSTKIRIVQANIEQNIDLRIKNSYQNLLTHISLSKDAKDKGINYIIWPESSHEFNLDQSLLNILKPIIPSAGGIIINSVRTNPFEQKIWNSLFTVNADGMITDSYDKIHIVPLGEFIPFRAILPFINKITPGSVDFSRGAEYKIINTEPAFLPSICYEDAFPTNSDKIFTWIVNITNDGWFGTSFGPYQHLVIASYRSIEQGVPMIRASLTGISAVINSFGEIEKNIPLLTQGIIDAQLPGYIENYTLYHNYGNLTVFLLIISVFLIKKIFEYI